MNTCPIPKFTQHGASLFTPRAYAVVANCLIWSIAVSSCLDTWSSATRVTGSCLIEEVQEDSDSDNTRLEFDHTGFSCLSSFSDDFFLPQCLEGLAGDFVSAVSILSVANGQRGPPV
jgi:hypothetical protein